MKQIDIFFFEDDFDFKESEIFGTKMYTDSKIISTKMSILYKNAIGRVCEKCGGFSEGILYTCCESCREKKKAEQFRILPSKESENIYCEKFDVFIEDGDWITLLDEIDVSTYDEIINLKLEDMRFYACQNSYAQTIDIANCFEDVSIEDFSATDFSEYAKLNSLIEEANLLIRNNPVGYEPDYRFKAVVSKEEWSEIKSDLLRDISFGD